MRLIENLNNTLVITMADGEISSDEWSDDEFIDQIGDFDLHHLDENDRQRLNSVLQNFENNPDNDTGDVRLPHTGDLVVQ